MHLAQQQCRQAICKAAALRITWPPQPAVRQMHACRVEAAAVLWGVRQARLWQLGKLMPARLAQHMEAYGTLPVRSAMYHACLNAAVML